MNDNNFEFVERLMKNWHQYVPEQKEMSATAKALMPLHDAINKATEDMDIHNEPSDYCIVLARLCDQKGKK